MGGSLLFFVFHFDLHLFEVFSFENLAAVKTLHVVHAIPAGDDLSAVVVTGGLHKNVLREIYSIQV